MIPLIPLQHLPDCKSLQSSCKAMAALDAILSQDWVYRYFSYDAKWSDYEALFELRDGQGDQILILFNQEGCVMNGLVREVPPFPADQLFKSLPSVFHEFVFDEPVKSIGTSFCVWYNNGEEWQGTPLQTPLANDLLLLLDGKPETYLEWATGYYGEELIADGLPLQTLQKIYNLEPLTRELILTLVNDIEDWDQLIDDLDEISYPHHLLR